MLVGLPELDDRLSLRRNRSLYSRLQRRFYLEPLTAEDTAEYLRMRLGRAGCDRELFAADAVAMLHLGSTTKTHPLVVLIAVLGGGIMFGVVGLLLALPTVTICKALISSSFHQLKAYGDI